MELKTNKNQDRELNIIELIKQLWNHRWFLVKAGSVFLIAGIIIAVSIPREYTCTVKMAPEGSKTGVSGMSDLAAMAGINIGSTNMEGINLTVYPDVVQSIPFITELVNMKIPKEAKQQTLYEYIDKDIKQPWWNIITSSPFKLLALIRKGGKEVGTDINPYKLTEQQEEVLNALRERISITIDKKTGIIMTGVTLQDAELSAIVADSLVDKLVRSVINYRTNKAKQDFDFATKMFNESKAKYYESQRNYARYVDANKNIILESVHIEQERLKNEQALAYNVYSTLAQQVEKARLKVQEQTPCVTVIEPARIPVKKSNTSRLKIMLICGFLGLLGGAAKVIYSNWDKIQIVK